MIDPIILAYLAGVMDSDGYFGIKRDTYHLRVRKDARVPLFHERLGIKQVSSEAILLLKNCFGGSISHPKPSSDNGKPLYGWAALDKKGAEATEALLPYLRIKRRQAECVLKLRALKILGPSGRDTTPMPNRWGKLIVMNRRIMTGEDTEKRQALYDEVRSLNKIGNGSHPISNLTGPYTPIPVQTRL